MKAATFLPNHFFQWDNSPALHTKPTYCHVVKARPTAGSTSHIQGPGADVFTGLKDTATTPDIHGLITNTPCS